MKTCTQCGNKVPATTEFFHKDSSKSCGLAPSCKTCKVAKTIAWARRNPERARETNRRNRAKHGHTYELRKLYGIDSEIYHAMLNTQGGVCAICSAPPTKKRLAVDHDHKTGKNRGLLCAMCNHALERMESIPDWHEKAIAYLVKYEIAKREKEFK